MDDGAGRDVERIRVGSGFAGLNRKVGGGGDHGAVVGAKFWCREIDLVCLYEGLSDGLAKELVSADATGEEDGFG